MDDTGAITYEVSTVQSQGEKLKCCPFLQKTPFLVTYFSSTYRASCIIQGPNYVPFDHVSQGTSGTLSQTKVITLCRACPSHQWPFLFLRPWADFTAVTVLFPNPCVLYHFVVAPKGPSHVALQQQWLILCVFIEVTICPMPKTNGKPKCCITTCLTIYMYSSCCIIFLNGMMIEETQTSTVY